MASTDAPSFTLKYRAERHERWNWYWRSFLSPRGLWGYWLVVAFLISVAVLGVQTLGYPVGVSGYVLGAALLIVLLGFFVTYPQVAYNPRERTLVVSEKGIESTVGTAIGKRSWQDVASIAEFGETIAIVIAGGARFGPFWIRTLNGNAFIIPDRAFANPVQRAFFLEQVQGWHKENQLSFPRFSMTRYYADEDATVDDAIARV